MTRFISALALVVLIIAVIIASSAFTKELYYGLDVRLGVLEAAGEEADVKAVNELYDYWKSRAHAASFSIKESEIRAMTALLSKLKVCRGDEYAAALSGARLMAEELRKTESMAFFDLF